MIKPSRLDGLTRNPGELSKSRWDPTYIYIYINFIKHSPNSKKKVKVCDLISFFQVWTTKDLLTAKS
jgi:hypothetical protein